MGAKVGPVGGTNPSCRHDGPFQPRVANFVAGRRFPRQVSFCWRSHFQEYGVYPAKWPGADPRVHFSNPQEGRLKISPLPGHMTESGLAGRFADEMRISRQLSVPLNATALVGSHYIGFGYW
jgi:hypothetical protein